MKRKLLASCLVVASASTVSQAGQLTVANSDITLSGAVSTGYFYSTNTGSSNHDDFKVSNFLIGLGSDAKDGGIGFSAGFGSVLLPMDLVQYYYLLYMMEDLQTTRQFSRKVLVSYMAI